MDFARLSHDRQIASLEQRAAEALARYPLRGVRHRLLQYEDNAVYGLTDVAGERYVLRLGAAGGHGALEQSSEMQWLVRLGHAENLRVPRPVVNSAGELVTALATTDPTEPHLAVVLRWVAGEPPSPPVEPATLARLGEVTGRMHLLAADFATTTTVVRPSWDWERLFGTNSVLAAGLKRLADPGLDEIQLDLLAAIRGNLRRELAALRSRPGAWGLIHGDLHRDNVLVQGEEVGVIDFDDCGWGFLLYDAASVLDSTYRRLARDRSEYQRLRDAYLSGYDRVRQLPAGAFSQLATLKAVRDLVTLDFILGSPNAAVRGWGAARVPAIFDQLRAYLEGSPALGI